MLMKQQSTVTSLSLEHQRFHLVPFSHFTNSGGENTGRYTRQHLNKGSTATLFFHFKPPTRRLVIDLEKYLLDGVRVLQLLFFPLWFQS